MNLNSKTFLLNLMILRNDNKFPSSGKSIDIKDSYPLYFLFVLLFLYFPSFTAHFRNIRSVVSQSVRQCNATLFLFERKTESGKSASNAKENLKVLIFYSLQFTEQLRLTYFALRFLQMRIVTRETLVFKWKTWTENDCPL